MHIRLPDAVKPCAATIGWGHLFTYDSRRSTELRSFTVACEDKALLVAPCCTAQIRSPVVTVLAMNGPTRRIIFTLDRFGSSAYDLQSLSPLPDDDRPGTIHLARDQAGERLLAASAKEFRILKFSDSRVVATSAIEFQGIKAAAFNREYALVANSELYALVDLKRKSTLPLFAVAPGLRPYVAVISRSEFFVVQGTTESEPSMGLVVSKDGEITRKGQILTWDSYPRALVVDRNYVVAVIGNDLVVHDINGQFTMLSSDAVELESDTEDEQIKLRKPEDSKEIPEFHPLIASLMKTEGGGSAEDSTEIPGRETIELSLCDPISVPCPSLEPLLGAGPGATTDARVLLRYSGSLRLWAAPSEFHDLVKQILDNNLRAISPEIIDANTERGVAQLEYLSLLLALQLLNSGEWAAAVPAWLDGIYLDPAYVLYVFAHIDEQSLPSTFPGIIPHMHACRNSPKPRAATSFLKTYLRAQVRRFVKLKSPEPHKHVSLKMISVLVDLEQSDDTLFTLLKSLPEGLQAQELSRLEANGRLDTVSKFLESTAQVDKLVVLWLRVLQASSIDSQTSKDQAASKLANALIRSGNSDLVWDTAQILVRYDPEAAVQVFTEPDRVCKYSFQDVTTMLRNLDNSDAWRLYLNYLVHVEKEPIYTKDLATLLLTEILDLYKHTDVSAMTQEQLSKYQSQRWPKKSFHDVLQSARSHCSDSRQNQFCSLRLELCDLILSGKSDDSPIYYTIQNHAPKLLLEKALLASQMGLYSQALDILITELSDFTATMLLCKSGTLWPNVGEQLNLVVSEEMRLPLASEAFKIMIVHLGQSEDGAEILSSFLSNVGQSLDLAFTVSLLPESWDAYLFTAVLESLLSKEESMLAQLKTKITLTKGSSRRKEQCLQSLKSAI